MHEKHIHFAEFDSLFGPTLAKELIDKRNETLTQQAESNMVFALEFLKQIQYSKKEKNDD